jgi:hypothetical protein
MPHSLTTRPTIGQLRKEQSMKTKILSILVFGAVIATGAASQAQAQPCSNAMLKGTYGFQSFGAVVVAPGSPGTPRAVIGIYTMDGRGNFTGNVTLNDNGTIINTGPFAGTYEVNADCRGALFGAGGTIMLVVVDGGKEFYQMRIDPAMFVVIGPAKRVSSGDNGGNQQ